MKNSAMIGAGLSRTLLTMNLLKQRPDIPVQISWIDRNDGNDLGPAYSAIEDYLLYVPIDIMGIFSDNPAHFLQ